MIHGIHGTWAFLSVSVSHVIKYLFRSACYRAGVHCVAFKGIHGSSHIGAYSIVLKGTYEDDQDGGDWIIYTGSGGRTKTNDGDDRNKMLGPGASSMKLPQLSDQSFDYAPNKALQLNLYSGYPVRVIRGSNSRSKYAPRKGYRYDGLYKVTLVSGFTLCIP